MMTYHPRASRVALLGLFLSVAVAWAWVADKPAAVTTPVKLRGHTFTVPAGFTVELIAGPPLVDRPITADFDEQGRLYVTESSGTNDKVDVQLQQKPHRVLRLEDSDGDGVYDKRTVFADQMMFPEGSMWFAGSLYVAAPPSIWKLTDTDGDGVADQRGEWFQGKTLTGCANDLHGPYLGPDGWIYWCKGAFAKQTYERPGKAPFVTRASHIFRTRPDGTGLEHVMTGGMDNPVDVVFTPGGERVFTTTFFQRPGGGKRDGLIHAVYGGIYGKDHDPIYEHKWTGPELMPVLTHLGAAAPCGLVRAASRSFGPAYQDNVYACLFNMQKVTRHVLVPEGASFKTEDSDFLVSDNRDFHPTDILEDADGSIVVVDTGGWYKLCCPTSQLHKPDILGGIYRVRRTGAPKVQDPRGLKIAWDRLDADDLAKLLGDARPAVRQRATQVLAGKKDAVAALAQALESDRPVESRRGAVWAASWVDNSDARALARDALHDPDETVRQAAAHVVSVWRDRAAGPALVSLLKAASPHNRRAAAEALGRLGDAAAVPALLAALETPADRALENSLIYALIEIADRQGTAAGLAHSVPNVRRAALIALDQMDGGNLEAQVAARELSAADGRLKEAASWIVGRHPEWGNTLAGYLRERLRHLPAAATEQEELARQLARFGGSPAVQALLVERLADASDPQEVRILVLKAMALSNLKETPAAWIQGLTAALSGSNGAVLREAVATARAFPASKKPSAELAAALLRVGGGDAPAAVRLNALAAVPGGVPKVEPALFDFLTAHLDREQPVAERAAAAEVLARAKLNAGQLLALGQALKSVNPMELDRVLEAFAQSTEERVGLGLIASLQSAPARSALRVDALRQRLTKYGPAVHKEAEALYAALDADLAKQKAKLEQLLTTLQGGDVYRGQAVFNGTKAACSSCHAVGYLGGNVGPDLTHIARIRTERDLLEAIVFPSASFVRSYEPVVVATRDGKVQNGILRKDAPDEVVLAVAANQEVRIPRGDVEEMQPGKVSVMPSGLDQQLTPGELADLIAFLKACK